MAYKYKNEYVKRAAELNKSKYGVVNKYKDTALQAIDTYYSDSQRAVDNAYAKKQKAIDSELSSALSQRNAGIAEADNDFSQSRRSAYAAYEGAINNTGVTGDGEARTGLTNSGWSDTRKALSFRNYQSQLSEAETNLQKQIQSYEKAYNEALQKGETERANAVLEQINEGNALQKEIAQMITNVGKTAYDLDYKERYLAYSKSK